MSVLVLGEALIDLISDPADPRRFTAHPGGSPANVAVALARLGTPVSFAGRFANDGFGRLLRAHLLDNGVDLSPSVEAAEPASLAVVTVGPDGGAEYAFYVDNTADWHWTGSQLPRPVDPGVRAVHTGSIALARPPGSAALELWLAAQRRERTVCVDPNVRPALVGDQPAYRARVERWMHVTDIVKVSVDDLAWAYPGEDPVETARRWIALPEGPVVVVVTRGAAGSLAVLGSQLLERPVATSPAADPVDTVGAGDAFTAGLLDWLDRHERLGRDALARLTSDELDAALDWASRVAAVTVSRPGADPPRRSELCP